MQKHENPPPLPGGDVAWGSAALAVIVAFCLGWAACSFVPRADRYRWQTIKGRDFRLDTVTGHAEEFNAKNPNNEPKVVDEEGSRYLNEQPPLRRY